MFAAYGSGVLRTSCCSSGSTGELGVGVGVGQLVEKAEWCGGRRFLLGCELTGWPMVRGKVVGLLRPSCWLRS